MGHPCSINQNASFPPQRATVAIQDCLEAFKIKGSEENKRFTIQLKKLKNGENRKARMIH